MHQVVENICHDFNITQSGSSHILEEIFKFAIYKNPCFILQSTWAKKFFRRRETIYRWIKNLIRKGIILITKKPFFPFSNEYSINPGVLQKYFCSPSVCEEKEATMTKEKVIPSKKETKVLASYHNSLKELSKKNLMMESEIYEVDSFFTTIINLNSLHNITKIANLYNTLTKSIKDLKSHKHDNIFNPPQWFISNYMTHLKRSFLTEQDSNKLDKLLYENGYYQRYLKIKDD